MLSCNLVMLEEHVKDIWLIIAEQKELHKVLNTILWGLPKEGRQDSGGQILMKKINLLTESIKSLEDAYNKIKAAAEKQE